MPGPGPGPGCSGLCLFCLETSRSHLILPLALSKRPSRQGSASPALPLLGSSFPEAVLPPVLSLSSLAAIFRPGLLVLSPHFLEIYLPMNMPFHAPSLPHPCSPGRRTQGSKALKRRAAGGGLRVCLWVQIGLCAESDSISYQLCDLVSHITLLCLLRQLNEMTAKHLAQSLAPSKHVISGW